MQSNDSKILYKIIMQSNLRFTCKSLDLQKNTFSL